MRVCYIKSTNEFREAQELASPGTLIRNAIAAGHLSTDIVEEELPTGITLREYIDAHHTPTAQEINAPILVQLAEIDRKSIRALRSNDSMRLTSLEAQAVALRAQLRA